MWKVAVVLALASLGSGCMAARAHTPVERPALEVPPAPPRTIEPAPLFDLPAPEPEPEVPEKSAAPAPKPRPSSARDASRETSKPEPKPEIPPVEQSPPAPVPQQPPPPLRTATTADAARIREILANTQRMLGNIDYQRLRPERKSAYDQAKSNAEGAEAALKGQDFDLAKELADKAEKLTLELLAR